MPVSCLCLLFRELGGVNSSLGVKQNCPSPNASDALKNSERVNVYFSFLILLKAYSFLPSSKYLGLTLVTRSLI